MDGNPLPLLKLKSMYMIFIGKLFLEKKPKNSNLTKIRQISRQVVEIPINKWVTTTIKPIVNRDTLSYGLHLKEGEREGVYLFIL